jgi:adenylate kinase
MKLIMLGAPGAGKGTVGAVLRSTLNIPIISTGDILRAAVKDGTPLGLQVKDYMEAGKLVPDDIIFGIIVERLAQSDCANGYILDGVPRTIIQAEAMEKAGFEFDHVISMEISDEIIEERMEGRRFCPGCGATYHIHNIPPRVEGVCDKCGSALAIRDDDQPETVKRRLKIYHDNTEPLKEFYAQRGVLFPVDATGTLEENTAAILDVLKG